MVELESTSRALGPFRLLPSGRLGRQVAINRSDKPVFVDGSGTPMCAHGERAPSIMCWLAQERANPEYVRPSMCDCGNIDGLMTDYNLRCNPCEDATLAEQPLYKLLGAIGSEERVVNTRPQRKALVTREGEIWVQPSGTLVCEHGNARKLLTKIASGKAQVFKRKSTVACSCKLKIPRRFGSVFASTKCDEKLVGGM